ncbi:murein biosynthesis integral membrane protein MurJ [Patescibacteria group bacterium]|nr:murein biosynthesis integral membrane protein MurJ [Patescibacteria group bacterium]
MRIDFSKAFHFSSRNLTLSAWILAAFSFLSAILGLFRDRLLASNFGASRELSIYAASFRIPDLVYNLLIAGGLSIAFLPVFADYFSRDKKRAWEIASNILNIFIVFLTGLSIVFCIFTPWLIKFIVPGFSLTERQEVINLTRILFLSPVLFGMANILSGVLQYFQKFVALGMAPILYNLGIIFGIIFLSPRMGILGVGVGVIIGAFLYFLSQLTAAIFCGFSWQKQFNFKDPASTTIFRLAVPRLISVASQQVNLLVITAIASTISSGAIAIFYYANNLQGMIVSLIGVSFASATFPLLARAVSEENEKEFLKNFSSAFRQILFFTIPSSILLFLLKSNVVKIILQSGKFDSEAVKLTVAGLGIFAISIFAQAGNHLLVRTFFSLKQGRRPAEIAVFSSILNVCLALLFVNLLSNQTWFRSFFEGISGLKGVSHVSIIGLILAFSISTIFQFILLLISLKGKVNRESLPEILESSVKIILASIVMIILVLPLMGFKANIIFQTVLVSLLAGLVYLLASHFLGSRELNYFKESLLKRFKE